VHVWRAGAGRFTSGVTFFRSPVSTLQRSTVPPNEIDGFSGSGAVKPDSPPAHSGSQSRIVMLANLPRERTRTAPLSCCAPVTQYGKLKSGATWYTSAIDWFSHDDQVG